MSNFTEASRWFVRPAPRFSAKLRLYCLPYAGGAASVFARWHQRLPTEVDVIAVQLPGREQRYRDPLPETLAELADDLAAAIRRDADRSFIVFGHSFGALAALETTRRLEERGEGPAALFVSALRPPHIPDPEPHLHHEPDDEFLRRLNARYNAVPEVILREPELRAFYTKSLRGDFRLLETHSFDHGRRTRAPIVAFGGCDDAPHSSSIDAWSEHTLGRFDKHLVPGGHFFIQQSPNEFFAALNQALAPWLTR